jgi:hypothetical protein
MANVFCRCTKRRCDPYVHHILYRHFLTTTWVAEFPDGGAPDTIFSLCSATMSLPEATFDDIRRTGITPEAIGDEMERQGYQVNGKIVSFSVLTDITVSKNF